MQREQKHKCDSIHLRVWTTPRCASLELDDKLEMNPAFYRPEAVGIECDVHPRLAIQFESKFATKQRVGQQFIRTAKSTSRWWSSSSTKSSP